MDEIEKTKRVETEDEDWGVLPFDEREDEARWENLGADLDELLEKTAATEKLTGPILMENDLSRYLTDESEIENEDLLF